MRPRSVVPAQLRQIKIYAQAPGCVPLTTGLGVADDLNSLMVMTDPSAVGLAGQEAITKTPLCEDMVP